MEIDLRMELEFRELVVDVVERTVVPRLQRAGSVAEPDRAADRGSKAPREDLQVLLDLVAMPGFGVERLELGRDFSIRLVRALSFARMRIHESELGRLDPEAIEYSSVTQDEMTDRESCYHAVYVCLSAIQEALLQQLLDD